MAAYRFPQNTYSNSSTNANPYSKMMMVMVISGDVVQKPDLPAPIHVMLCKYFEFMQTYHLATMA